MKAGTAKALVACYEDMWTLQPQLMSWTLYCCREALQANYTQNSLVSAAPALTAVNSHCMFETLLRCV
jgi:hypothetical protein